MTKCNSQLYKLIVALKTAHKTLPDIKVVQYQIKETIVHGQRYTVSYFPNKGKRCLYCQLHIPPPSVVLQHLYPGLLARAGQFSPRDTSYVAHWTKCTGTTCSTRGTLM